MCFQGLRPSCSSDRENPTPKLFHISFSHWYICINCDFRFESNCCTFVHLFKALDRSQLDKCPHLRLILFLPSRSDSGLWRASFSMVCILRTNKHSDFKWNQLTHCYLCLRLKCDVMILSPNLRKCAVQSDVVSVSFSSQEWSISEEPLLLNTGTPSSKYPSVVVSTKKKISFLVFSVEKWKRCGASFCLAHSCSGSIDRVTGLLFQVTEFPSFALDNTYILTARRRGRDW